MPYFPGIRPGLWHFPFINIQVLFPKPTVRECAHRAVQAQPALAQHREIFRAQLLPRRDPREHKVKDRALCIHHAPRQPHNRNACFSIVPAMIRQHEHCPRQHRCAVCDDLVRRIADGERGPVVRVHAHPSGAHDQISAFFDPISDGVLHNLRPVVTQGIPQHFHIIFFQLSFTTGVNLSSIRPW